MKTYTTKGGEMLDGIVHAHYGTEKVIIDVMRVNPGIERLPLFLPRGVSINLPAMQTKKEKRRKIF